MPEVERIWKWSKYMRWRKGGGGWGSKVWSFWCDVHTNANLVVFWHWLHFSFPWEGEGVRLPIAEIELKLTAARNFFLRIAAHFRPKSAVGQLVIWSAGRLISWLTDSASNLINWSARWSWTGPNWCGPGQLTIESTNQLASWPTAYKISW